MADTQDDAALKTFLRLILGPACPTPAEFLHKVSEIRQGGVDTTGRSNLEIYLQGRVIMDAPVAQ